MRGVPEAPTFRPSPEEFADPVAYIRSIQGEASRSGVCKIVPPFHAAVTGPQVLRRGGRPAGGSGDRKGPTPFRFSTRAQDLRARRGPAVGRVKFHSSKEFELAEFEEQALALQQRLYGSSAQLGETHAEAEFWRWSRDAKGLTLQYGDNVEGSAFSQHPADRLGRSAWNLARLPRLPDSVLAHVREDLPGVNEPMLYLGMVFSQFAWHVEDHYLYSTSFLHAGAPKTWYAAPAEDAAKVEAAVQAHVFGAGPTPGGDGPVASSAAVRSLMGKTTMVSPKVLMEAGVKVCRVVHRPGEYVVTFPRAYHGGFNHGLNLAEAVNFALDSWLPFGLAAERRYRALGSPCMLSTEQVLLAEARVLAQRLEGDCGTCGGAAAPATAPAAASDPMSSPEGTPSTEIPLGGRARAAAEGTARVLEELRARVSEDAAWAAEQGWTPADALPGFLWPTCTQCKGQPHFIVCMTDTGSEDLAALCMACGREAWAARAPQARGDRAQWLFHQRDVPELASLCAQISRALGGDLEVAAGGGLNGLEDSVADCRGAPPAQPMRGPDDDVRGRGGAGALSAGGTPAAAATPRSLRFSRASADQQLKKARVQKALNSRIKKVQLAEARAHLAAAQSRAKASGAGGQRCPSKPRPQTKAGELAQATARQSSGCSKCRYRSGCKQCLPPGGLPSLQNRLQSGAGPPGPAQPKPSPSSPSAPAHRPVRASP